MKILTIEQLHEIISKDLLPKTVAEDVTKRLNDWKESGGCMDSDNDYVRSQLKYAERVLNREEFLSGRNND